MRISIIGTGVYALAVAKLLLTTNDQVTMWTEKEDLDSIEVPCGARFTNSYKEACCEADLIFIMTSAKFVSSVIKASSRYIRPECIVILGTKGILADYSTPLDISTSILKNRIGVLSGPTFACDIDALDPIGFTLGSADYEVFEVVKNVMPTVALEYSDDVDAIEMAGSLKNAYAIGSGIIAGLGYGPSTSCLFITKVLKEIEQIYEAMSYDTKSILTLAGVGDLVLTCTSTNSRNFTLGTKLAKEDRRSQEDYLKNNTVEGFENIKIYSRLFKERNIPAPILETIYEILIEESDTSFLIELLTR